VKSSNPTAAEAVSVTLAYRPSSCVSRQLARSGGVAARPLASAVIRVKSYVDHVRVERLRQQREAVEPGRPRRLAVHPCMIRTARPQRKGQRSRAYLFHLIPVTVLVRWTMTAAADTEDTTTFSCTVETEIPTALRLPAQLTALLHLNSVARRSTITSRKGQAGCRVQHVGQT
jgi:hypothetical protein